MSVESLLKELESQVQAGNVEPGKATLRKLKIALLEASAAAVNNPQQQAALATASASALELGVLLSVADNDLDAFGRNMAQLQPYYMMQQSKDSTTAASPRKAHVIGLNLMHLLVENRLSEFHSQLELLSDKEASDPYISFPIGLERKLMVGIYDEVLNHYEKMPNPQTYQLFMENLLQTVRDSIADCMEVSYQTLSLKDASKLMKFNNVNELREYIVSDRDDWIVSDDNNTITFQPPTTASAAADIPSMEWIQQSLTYATEMERIV